MRKLLLFFTLILFAATAGRAGVVEIDFSQIYTTNQDVSGMTYSDDNIEITWNQGGHKDDIIYYGTTTTPGVKFSATSTSSDTYGKKHGMIVKVKNSSVKKLQWYAAATYRNMKYQSMEFVDGGVGEYEYIHDSSASWIIGKIRYEAPGYGTPKPLSYMVTFKTGPTTQSSNSGSVQLNYAVETGAEYLDGSITGQNIGFQYVNGLKIGTSSAAGNALFTMSDEGQVDLDKIVFHTATYDAGVTYSLAVNGTTVATGISAAADYTYTPTEPVELKTIKLTTALVSKKGRIYLKGFDVYRKPDSAPQPTVTYEPEPGEYEYGTLVTFTVANSTKTDVTILDSNGNDMAVTTIEEGSKYSFSLTSDPEIEISALGADGGTYTFNPVYTVMRPYFSHDPNDPIEMEEDVTFTAPGCSNIYLYEYGIDGIQLTDMYDIIDGNTQTLHVDKMHRRWKYCLKYNDGTFSPWTEVFFEVVKQKAAPGETKYVLADSRHVFVKGDEFVLTGAYTASGTTTTYVMGSPASSTANNVAGISFTVNGDITTLPEGTSVIKVVTVNDENYPYALMVGDNYLYNTSSASTSNNYNYLKLSSSLDSKGHCTISVDDSGIATITFNNSGKSGAYVLKFNYNNGSTIFATYGAGQTLPALYLKQETEAKGDIPMTYDITVHHTPYKDPEGVRHAPAAKDHENSTTMDREENVTPGGYHMYSAELNNLNGYYAFMIEGEEELAADNLSATKDFHSDGDYGCSDEHEPYVFVANGSDTATGLVLASRDNTAPLSSHSNIYHGSIEVQPKAKVNLSFKPFDSIYTTLSYDPTLTEVINVAAGSDANAPAEYYNLQGMRVHTPVRGNVYIRVQGSTAGKIMY